jgi:hypothetical protein
MVESKLPATTPRTDTDSTQSTNNTNSTYLIAASAPTFGVVCVGIMLGIMLEGLGSNVHLGAP